VTEHKTAGLGVLPSTAICGNDITSSCLYVSALTIVVAGRWAPLALLLVVGVLYLFRRIYGEVVGALPLNGGAYNALLNTTSKSWASVAACLTLLSYMATAVISAAAAMHYASALVTIPVVPMTIAVLAIFCCLTIIGIGESANVAIGIFLLHLSSLALLLVIGVITVVTNGLGTLASNLSKPQEGGWATALYFGFATALLGISGFESSANYVEEQQEGVFPKTLRNMWVAVGVLNPCMALLVLAIVPIDEISKENAKKLLAHVGGQTGGPWLSELISIDAILVLSGAVLTSYVGVTGLVRRMTLDRCLPQFLLRRNRRGSSHRIILGFFLLCTSVLLLTQGDLESLAGVYTISFLGVMVLFGTGNILLKVKRARLPRPERSSWLGLLLAITAVLIGNAIKDTDNLKIFLIYFSAALLIVGIMLKRTLLLTGMLFVLRRLSEAIAEFTGRWSTSIKNRIDEINSQAIVFFTRGDDLENLNQAMLYVRKNEHTNRIRVVTVAEDESEVLPSLRTDLEFLDRAYPEIDIDFEVVKGTFGPELIDELSKRWNVPKNFMFIGSPGDHFLYGLAELGGVRLII